MFPTVSACPTGKSQDQCKTAQSQQRAPKPTAPASSFFGRFSSRALVHSLRRCALRRFRGLVQQSSLTRRSGGKTISTPDLSSTSCATVPERVTISPPNKPTSPPTVPAMRVGPPTKAWTSPPIWAFGSIHSPSLKTGARCRKIPRTRPWGRRLAGTSCHDPKVLSH